ncbi:MAG: three-Cys-motif partner protein TcmP [Dehalococcoidia bacterium]
MTLWPLAPHTSAKHQILRHYLDAWLPKLAWTREVLMVDGFAGPGEYQGGEPGSPYVAVSAAKDHTGRLESCEIRFVFIEEDRARFENLETLVARIDLPIHIHVETICGTFDATMTSVLDEIDAAGAKLAPALVMVDPFGAKGMPIQTLRRIGAHPKSELLVSLMYEPISRWVGTPEFEPHLDELYGTPSWRDVRKFGVPGERRAFMLELYVSQLKSVVGMEHVSVFELRDSGNRVEYFLIHATHSLDGLKAIKEAMWRVDPQTGTLFSDATVGRGQPLFQLEPDFVLLRSQILSRFAGLKGVPVEDVERFVLTETAFRETHYKRQVLKSLESEGRIRISAPASRRRGTFPTGVRIDFG